MQSARPATVLNRTITKLFLCLLTIAVLTSCSKQPPATAAKPAAKSVSPECFEAMLDQVAGALYRPGSSTAAQLAECKGESEEAIRAATDEVLREAFGTSTRTPAPSPEP